MGSIDLLERSLSRVADGPFATLCRSRTVVSAVSFPLGKRSYVIAYIAALYCTVEHTIISSHSHTLLQRNKYSYKRHINYLQHNGISVPSHFVRMTRHEYESGALVLWFSHRWLAPWSASSGVGNAGIDPCRAGAAVGWIHEHGGETTLHNGVNRLHRPCMLPLK